MVAKASPSKSSLGSGGTVVTPTRRVLVVTDPLAIKSETQTPVTLTKRQDYAALQTVPQRLYFTKPLLPKKHAEVRLPARIRRATM